MPALLQLARSFQSLSVDVVMTSRRGNVSRLLERLPGRLFWRPGVKVLS
ncbi:hypothetical protein GGE43_005092 [Agrobacterium tumefaciens]|jgi:hypothetical protein|uniref:Uncharacterized protein n=1 Tax=Agrobacterium radiobacter TaxID=362 RepID=A0ABR6JED8_AGRRD|nr:hypothetical protein [Agrobacterium radiobacter]MBP2537049.1 hypothetical protein [Agrobacterium tumefaciens]MBB4338421.1 hypothetical protein [Agrobacterium radiobacter]MBB4409416.1 hypothetical protein [Agrobacterium radiobacter]MBB4454867.1 hypothetical protein [Agrobacterium radiobacter]